MEVIVSKDVNVGWHIRYDCAAYCCQDIICALSIHLPQILIEMRLGEPAFVIPCRHTNDIIGQHCPFCGEKLTRKENDNEVQG
jgi:hypothetical protein